VVHRAVRHHRCKGPRRSIREGLRHVVLEREACVAPSWLRHYDRLHLHTTKTTPRIVIMATGYNGVPRLPSVPGMDSFLGMATHAGNYKNPAPYRGKRTLVVGCGNSGAEFEAIIFATGYTPGLGNLIEGFDTIADQRGRPHRFGAETGIAGLYFVGFKNPATGALREIAREAPRVARAVRTAIGRTGPA
jgi:hypothetical protein